MLPWHRDAYSPRFRSSESAPLAQHALHHDAGAAAKAPPRNPSPPQTPRRLLPSRGSAPPALLLLLGLPSCRPALPARSCRRLLPPAALAVPRQLWLDLAQLLQVRLNLPGAHTYTSTCMSGARGCFVVTTRGCPGPSDDAHCVGQPCPLRSTLTAQAVEQA